MTTQSYTPPRSGLIYFSLLWWYFHCQCHQKLCYRLSHGCNEHEWSALFTLSPFSPKIHLEEKLKVDRLSKLHERTNSPCHRLMSVYAKNGFIKSVHRVFHLCVWLPVSWCWEAGLSRVTAAGKKLLQACWYWQEGSCTTQVLIEWRICERGKRTHWSYCVPYRDTACAAGPQWQGNGYRWCAG